MSSLLDTDQMSAQDKILSMSNYQLQAEFPSTMRAQGYCEEEIYRAVEIVAEFRERYKMPVIE